MTTVKDEKKKFREAIRRKLNDLSTQEFESNNLALSKNLFQFLNQESIIQDSSLIGGYAPFEFEPIWYQCFNAEKYSLSFPSISEIDQEMVYRKSKLNELLELTEFGAKILGPNKMNQVVVPDLILIPGIAFTKNGDRLGRGKGYFDRYLNNFQGQKIAVGFELQVLTQIPTELHDKKMNWLITEKNIYKLQ